MEMKKTKSVSFFEKFIIDVKKSVAYTISILIGCMHLKIYFMGKTFFINFVFLRLIVYFKNSVT